MNKRIIDVCCGSKMFWFDKDNADVEFCDNRVVPLTEYYPKRFIEVSPDTVCDFTDQQSGKTFVNRRTRYA